MSRDLTQLELLQELQPVAEENVNRHLSMAKDWHPHDYVPWDEGRNFAAMGGEDWDPEQSRLDEVAKAAMITNLLTEDNLPSYHREIAENFSQDGAWGTWSAVGPRGEPARHRDARLPRRHTRRRPRGTRERPHGPHDQRLHGPRWPALGSADLGRLRHVPGTGDARLAPQHRQGLPGPDRRQDAPAHRRGREPAHDLLPQHLRCRYGRGAGPDTARRDRCHQELPDARRGYAELPPQRRADGQARHLRPASASRRGRDAGAPEVERLRTHRLQPHAARTPARNSPPSSRVSRSRPPSSRRCATARSRGTPRVRRRPPDRSPPAPLQLSCARYRIRCPAQSFLPKNYPEVFMSPLRIGSLELGSPVVLAPMAGITNVAFRTLCRELELERAAARRVCTCARW